MGLFDNASNAELEELRAEVTRLKAGKDTTPSKSAEAERIGVHSSDKPRNFSEWMKFRRKAGTHVYYSKPVQEKIQTDFQALGRERFFGND